MEVIVFLAVLATAGILGAGVAAWLLYRSRIDGKRVENAREEASSVVAEAEAEKRRILLEGQEEVLKLRTTGENEIKEQRQELNRLERRYLQREEQLERKEEQLEGKNEALEK